MFGIQKLKERIESLELQAKYPAKHNVGDKPIKDWIITKKEFIVERFMGSTIGYDWYYELTNIKTGKITTKRF